MNRKEALKIYKDTYRKLNAYELVLSTTYYDKLTVAPKKGSKYCNEALAYMQGEVFSITTAPEFVEAVKILSKEDLGEVMNRDVKLTMKSLEDIIKFSKEETMEWSLLQMEGNDAWEKAKHSDDYGMFEPYLLKLIDKSKERAKKRNPNIDSYDLYLDDFEEGMNKKKYDEFFDLVKKELLPLIKEVNSRQDKIDDSFLYKYYPKDRQEKFMAELNRYLGFDKSWGYMGETEHPFTNGISKNDCRIATNYQEYNITSCIFSIIHEVGHAYYEHQVDGKYEGMMVKRMISSGMHESQSRFLENYMGRRASFWKKLYPLLQKQFPENLGDVSLEDFVKAINVSRSSLIRTEADELTYPIHILIRYEIEKGIYDGSISTKDLNVTWKKMYKEYLGVDVPNETMGILQDVHWSDASFGYFPTYALGSAIGAQILHKMEKDIDVDDCLSKGKIKVVTDYLKDNVQKYGAMYDYNTILKMATGETFKPKYYISYLKNKYKKLYSIR